MLLINNTDFVPGFQSQQPQAFLRQRGLGQTAEEQTNPFSWQEIQQAINAQLVFFTNLDRAQKGLQPLGEQYNPTINVAPSPEAKGMIYTGGAIAVGILALMFLNSKKR